MAKIKLDLEPDPEVSIFGISSHVNDYRLCWSLNRSLGLHFRRSKNDIVEMEAGIQKEFAVFEHHDHELEARYLLVSNHATDGILITEQRQTDYFLVADNILAERNPEMLQGLRDTEFVLTAYTLDFASLRKGHKLLP